MKRQSPFPWTTRAGIIIVDEVCSCGARRSAHEDLFGGAAYGQGACSRTGCSKYTWERSLSVGDVQDEVSR